MKCGVFMCLLIWVVCDVLNGNFHVRGVCNVYFNIASTCVKQKSHCIGDLIDTE